jgi:hypothetical protein
MKVRIAFVDVARRRLNLAPVRDLEDVVSLPRRGQPRRARNPKPGKDAGGAKDARDAKGGGKDGPAPKGHGPQHRRGGKPKGPRDGKGKKKGRGHR